MAIYAVGDIQGCSRPLMRLLEKVRFDPAEDRLWCVGDLVNRGPDSLGTLRFLHSLGDACISVLGNHDLHLLGQAAGEKPYRRDTLKQVLDAPDAGELIQWLRHRPLLHHDPSTGWCMIHAGLHPHWTLKKAKKRARRIEKLLRGDQWMDFCLQLHHSRFPETEPEKGKREKLLFATAVLTRARYCTQKGRFDWDVRTGAPRDKKEKPWFAHKKLAWRDQCRIVFGHWAAMGLVDREPHVLGLDTGCVWGGRLTLARLGHTGQPELVSVPCEACQKIGG